MGGNSSDTGAEGFSSAFSEGLGLPLAEPESLLILLQ